MKKSVIISLLTIATILCTAIYSFASTGKVTTDTLRLREKASTDSKTLTLLSANDEVEILGEEETGWYKVKYKEYVGYVAAQYINVLADTSKPNLNEDNNNQNTENNNTENSGQNKEANENSANNESAESKQTVDVITSGTKIYITPLINSLVIKTLEEEKQIEVVSEINDWSYIKFGTTTGWVRKENINKKEIENNTVTPENNNNNSSQKVGYISANSVNFRKTPNTTGEIITKLSRNAKVTVITTGEGWTEVEYNGTRGYVSNDYITDKEIETTSRGSVSRGESRTNTQNTKAKQEQTTKEEQEEPMQTGNVTGADVVAYAKKYLGYKYVSGGSSPSRGFDCSGFTTYVYKHFGISLSRTSRGQASNGKTVSKDNLAVGDIICFSSSRSSKSIGHVGIYVGGGRFIHSANSRQGVIISNVSGDGYYFVTASRVI